MSMTFGREHLGEGTRTCFGLCQMANRFQDSLSDPSLDRDTCPGWMGRPIQVQAQRPRDLGSPNPQLCSLGSTQELRQEISF